MTRGTASWLLPYPPTVRTYSCKAMLLDAQKFIGARNDKSPWRKFINLCKQLKRTRCEYSITYVDMGEHCRVLIEWVAP